MCNGDCNSSRLPTGGTIAVLRPPHESPHAAIADDPSADCDLFFENPKEQAGRTRAVFRSKNGGCLDRFGSYFMLIHCFGDLRAETPLSEEVRNALLAVRLKPSMDEHQGTARMDLPEKLEFSVGGKGVIGRKVSIVTGLGDSGARVAEGIIGWN